MKVVPSDNDAVYYYDVFLSRSSISIIRAIWPCI